MRQRRIGRYEILEAIASGGFATVYRARDSQLGREVALKVLHPHMAADPQYVERFLREARMAASINHPNVVTIHEVGREGDTHFIAMEYLPSSLERVLRQGRMPVGQAPSIVRQVALALQAAHQRGIIHRDLKPGNILLTEDGTAKVSDFGIARAAQFTSMTASGMMLGTPHYMSPEQGERNQADARSDIYSLGCVLYRMLTGQVPFDGVTPLEVIRKHVDAVPARVRQLRPEVPAEVERLVSRCLEKDPNRRFQTAAELAQAITSVLAPGQVGARSQPATPGAPPIIPTTRPTAGGGGRSGTPSSRPSTTAVGAGWWWLAGIAAVIIGAVAFGVISSRQGGDGHRQVQVSPPTGGVPAVGAVPPTSTSVPPTPTFTPVPPTSTPTRAPTQTPTAASVNSAPTQLFTPKPASGSVLDVTFDRPVTVQEIQSRMNALGHPEALIQNTGSNSVIIRTKVLEEGSGDQVSERQRILDDLEENIAPLTSASFWDLSSPSSADGGKQLYRVYCSMCHGVLGEGQPNWQIKRPDGSYPAPPHDDTGHTWHHSDGLLFRIVKYGGVSLNIPNFNSGMPAFGQQLQDEEIRSVINYLKALWETEQREAQAEASESDPFPE